MVFPLIFSSFLTPRSRYRSSFPFFQFCVFFFVFAVDSTVANLEYSNCAPQTCNGITIKYPFFLPSQSANGCGYPGFNLSCTNHNTTLLLQATTFNLAVLSIDYEGQTFDSKIADDSITGIHPCSYPNKTINPPSPLNITALDKIQTLYYNCTTTPTGDGGGTTYDITAQLVPSCSITTSGMYSYAFFDQDSPDSRGVQGMSCQTTVSFPVLTKFGAGDLTASLSSGFILGWSKLDSMPNCVDCSASGGRCGMNTTTGSFLCFCPDDTYSDTCNGGAPRRIHRRIRAKVVAVAAPFLIFLLIFGCCIKVCYHRISYRRHKLLGINRKCERFLRDHRVLTGTRYSYDQIKRMTNQFKHKLGQRDRIQRKSRKRHRSCGEIIDGKLAWQRRRVHQRSGHYRPDSSCERRSRQVHLHLYQNDSITGFVGLAGGVLDRSEYSQRNRISTRRM